MAIFPGDAISRRPTKPAVLFLIGIRINNFLALGDILFMSKTMPAEDRLAQAKDRFAV
jgi:hypothetical protein